MFHHQPPQNAHQRPPDSTALIHTNNSRPPVSFRQFILMPLMFFLVLLAIWVAPTINRVSAFINPSYSSYPLLLAVGCTDSLRGFWNGVIFITLGMKERKRQKALQRTYDRWRSLNMTPMKRWRTPIIRDGCAEGVLRIKEAVFGSYIDRCHICTNPVHSRSQVWCSLPEKRPDSDGLEPKTWKANSADLRELLEKNFDHFGFENKVKFGQLMRTHLLRL